MFLASAQKTVPPVTTDSFPIYLQAVEISWHRVIVEVAAHDRLEPLPRVHHRVMHPYPQSLFDFQQLGSHALHHGFPFHGKVALPILSTDVGKA